MYPLLPKALLDGVKDKTAGGGGGGGNSDMEMEITWEPGNVFLGVRKKAITFMLKV